MSSPAIESPSNLIPNGGEVPKQQFRIFKRGDEIPGVCNPPITQLVHPSTYQPASPSPQRVLKPPLKTPSTRLIELAKFNGLQSEFRLVKSEGPPHCPIFTVMAKLGPAEYSAVGPSIKKASIAAAELALAQSTLPIPPPRSQVKDRPLNNRKKLRRPNDRETKKVGLAGPATSINNMVSINPTNSPTSIAPRPPVPPPKEKNPISTLHEISMRSNGRVVFDVVEDRGPPHQKVFRMRCEVHLKDEMVVVEAEGPTKQAAKKVASELMLEKLSPTLTLEPSGSDLRRIRPKKPSLIIRDTLPTDSPISKLIHVSNAKQFGGPTFDLVEERKSLKGSNGKLKPEFTMRVTSGPFTVTAAGPSKRIAKTTAASKLLQQMNSDAPSVDLAPPKDEPDLKFTTGKQIAPGVIFLDNKSDINNSRQASAVENKDLPHHIGSFEDMEHTSKLDYLAKLIGAHLSFSDIPKKSEFLSVVSLSTTPPHVAHGVGTNLHQARNQASLKILEELANTGIDPCPNP